MRNHQNKIKLVAIVGPTASGKTALAVDLAEKFGGEIVCADSRTVYRGMDIGTAKPTPRERARVPHHLLDVVYPGETLTAAAFKALAEEQIADIAARGQVPFLVGGSGLYVDAVLYEYEFPTGADPERRRYLESLSDDALRELLAAEDPEAFERVDLANRRRVMRALETVGQSRSRSDLLRADTLLLGLRMNKEIAQDRISVRVEKMLEEGFIDEVRWLGERYGWESEAMTGIGYRAFADVVRGIKAVDEAKAETVRATINLWKRQMTWFKRNPAIVWLADAGDAERLVREFLS